MIGIQFLAAGEALQRLEKLRPGLLVNTFPAVNWNCAMGFRDVIAHQSFDLDSEQVRLICKEALPEGLAAIRDEGGHVSGVAGTATRQDSPTTRLGSAALSI